jgi:bifunctional non-homologous end joining protein LigD
MSDVLREMMRRLAVSKASFIEPCLPTLAKAPPTGPSSIHEIKHDGYRLQGRRDRGGVHLITRNGFEWTERYPLIVKAIQALRCDCVIDGEVVTSTTTASQRSIGCATDHE